MTAWLQEEGKARKWKHHVINRTDDPDKGNKHFEEWTQEDEQRVKGKGGSDKGKQQAEPSEGREGIDLWKAYWVANIKEQLAIMHNNYTIQKVGR